MKALERMPRFGINSWLSIVLILAALSLTACDSVDEPVEVEPMEQTGREAPVVEGASTESTSLEGDNFVQSAEIEDPERHLFANAEVVGVDGSGVTGSVHFRQLSGLLEISGTISGLKPGEHGLHVHEIGNCAGAGALSAGAHFSPAGDPHGSPQKHDAAHHAGDLGNITADVDGNAEFEIIDTELELGAGTNSIIDRALIVHANADDLVTQPAGDAGERVGCAVIRAVLRPAYVPE